MENLKCRVFFLKKISRTICNHTNDQQCELISSWLQQECLNLKVRARRHQGQALLSFCFFRSELLPLESLSGLKGGTRIMLWVSSSKVQFGPKVILSDKNARYKCYFLGMKSLNITLPKLGFLKPVYKNLEEILYCYWVPIFILFLQVDGFASFHSTFICPKKHNQHYTIDMSMILWDIHNCS